MATVKTKTDPKDRFVGDGSDFGFSEPEPLEPPDRFVSDGDDFEIEPPDDEPGEEEQSEKGG